jgi:hypothetical protein
VKECLHLVLVATLALCLSLVGTADVDGNPLTQDFPCVVLATPVDDVATCGDDVVDDAEQTQLRGRTAQVLMRHRTRRRWVTIMRRWHRSFTTDTPV